MLSKKGMAQYCSIKDIFVVNLIDVLSLIIFVAVKLKQLETLQIKKVTDKH